MIRRYFPIFVLTALAGCQSTSETMVSETTEDRLNSANDQFIAAEFSSLELIPDTTIAEAESESATGNKIYGNLWKRIQSQLTMDIPENRRLTIQRNWFIKHPSYLKRVAKRAEPFLYFIVEEIEKREMPMELALLPIVESAFNPMAYSPYHAAGLWQFVPGTADYYGLKRNWWYDGRRDVIESTRAALDYLEKLHQQFDGNWLHALAAYNSGEGRVARAIKRNFNSGENIDYWSLDLPRETDAYVPKLLALADLIKNPTKYGAELPVIANAQTVEVVDVENQIDLSIAAQMASIDLAALKSLNPGYARWSTSPEGPHTLLLPLKNAETLRAALADAQPNDLIKWFEYKVKAGDSLGLIAQKYNTSLHTLKTTNKIKGNLIRVGDRLLIPTGAAQTNQLAQSNEPSAEQANELIQTEINYEVKSGDTLWDISRAFNVTSRQIQQWNHLTEKQNIHPGQKLVIKRQPNTQVVATNKIKKVNYKVRRGDSLARIADKFNVTISDIENWNKISRKKFLQPGQTLALHVDINNI
ncbi:LysM peptidoglycan-binding domain-containing protein [Gayadomonas joobiniege]|uniref:LysM peptidoglycan-binding domain-containing protein n=1 Tax=Gayadomonas joobiniege TaxID=1234606 RepID=UPI000375AB54|nr:LysM peptidoglycan-binding domain-containing protein [Gayadomonas joobiniege]